MGVLNAKVGEDNSQWETVMGKYGIGDINDRGEKLLTFCATNMPNKYNVEAEQVQ